MPTPFHLYNKTILITGASSGIGAQCAVSASRMGAKIILTGRNATALQTTLGLLSGNGHSIIVADLQEENERNQLIQTVSAIDGLVHSAGVVNLFPIKLMNEEVIDETDRLNYKAPFLLTAGIIKHRKFNKNGSIVFISSISGQNPHKGGSVYSASKAALEAISKTIALEFSDRGIRSNCVSPAMVQTKILDEAVYNLGQESMDKHLEKYPLGVGYTEDVANAVVFLLSDGARWITGTNMVLDGGYLLNKG